MVIDRKRGFCFVHVPKTGGKSVTAALGGHTREVEWHLPAVLVPGYEKLYTFGFVRNPWDWLVSHYEFLCQRSWMEGDLYDQEKVQREGFREWLLNDPFLAKEDPVRRPACLTPMQRRSQMYWLYGCDFIGRFETLVEDFAKVCDWLGLEGLELPHKNATERRPYQDYYDDHTRDVVARWHAGTIKQFGYTF